jgi:hypothetical protein
MDDTPPSQQRPDNLFEAAQVDYGTHGRFDRQSKASSLQWWLTSHRTELLVAGGLAAALAIVGCAKKSPDRDQAQT